MRNAPQANRVCDVCGASVVGDEQCSACLLGLGLSAFQSEPVNESASGPQLPSPGELDQQFPDLHVTRLIGRGGMGAIYHARQISLDRDVALKIIAREVSGDAAFVERFEREAKALAKLSHANIVTVYDFGRTEDGLAYLTMEFIDGKNLREVMQVDSLSADQVSSVLKQVCDGLAYAHQKGIVHRDIKPENIMLAADGGLKIADFGIAKIVDQSIPNPTLTATKQVLGSLHYLAPEYLESPNEVDHRVDLYSIGVVAYELLTQELPLGRYEPPSTLIEDPMRRQAFALFDSVIMKLLQRKPQNRYQSAGELAEDIDNVSRQSVPMASLLEDQGPEEISIPFKLECSNGLTEVNGVVYGSKAALRFEFKRGNTIFGTMGSRFEEFEIARENLTRFEVSPKVFSDRITIAADRISRLGSLPDSEKGSIDLQIQKQHTAAALNVAKRLGFGSNAGGGVVQPTLEGLLANDEKTSQRVVFAILLVMCGILNGGFLAIAETWVSDELRGGHASKISAHIFFAVTVGPIALLQMVLGFITLGVSAKTVTRTASVIGLIPFTPVILVSGPLGIWALRRLHDDSSKLASPVPATPKQQATSWGATTLMYIRESRWSKFVGVVNGLVGLVIFAAVFCYWNGLYHTELNFRVVDTSLDVKDVSRLAEARLEPGIYLRTTQGQIEANIMKYQVQSVRDALAITHQVYIVSLSTSLKPDQAGASIPLAGPLTTSNLTTVETPFGPGMVTLDEPKEFETTMFSELKYGSDGKFQIKLSRSGQKSLAEKLPTPTPNSQIAFGLVVDEQIVALATSERLTRDLTFELLADPNEGWNERSLEAAIRGPVLGTDLELLP